MNRDSLIKLLRLVKEGSLGVEEAAERLKFLPFEVLEEATVDHHREIIKGFPEVIMGEGKGADQIAAIAVSLRRAGSNVLITRLGAQVAETISRDIPELTYHARARLGVIITREVEKLGKGKVLVICAGTSDTPVAEEAAVTAELLGNEVERLFDVGVAGLHRLMAHRDRITSARVIVVVAGMEGALPSVVGSLVSVPVVAVPTSVGYGASMGGFTALLAMLNSCVPGVVVVNIDNGFGAACAATLINRL